MQHSGAQSLPFGGYPQPYAAPSYLPYGAYPQQGAAQQLVCPTYTPPGGPIQAQLPQHPYAIRLVGIARSLEQAIPTSQVLFSVLHELIHARPGQSLPGAATLVNTLREIAFHHSAALGSIRRFLCGEATTGVLNALALHINYLAREQNQLQSVLERLSTTAAAEQRPVITGLSRSIATADSLLNQASLITQSMVEPRIWETARTTVFGTAPGAESGAGSP